MAMTDCASPRFWDEMSPFYDRLPAVPGFGADTTAGKIGPWITGATAAAFAAHGAARPRLTSLSTQQR
jgi:hydrogenase small subunit